MKKILTFSLILLISSCTLYRKDDATDSVRPVLEDLIKDKAVSGLRIELTKIPPGK
jgi:hypothetical protein